MRILVLAVGRLKEPHFRAAEEEYVRRVARYGPVDVREVEDDARLLKAIPDRACLVALDSRGDQLSSKELADLVAREQQHGGGRPLVFLIGGADGLPDDLRKRAHRVVAFGRITLPHRLARVVLLEQVYRAFTILRGEPTIERPVFTRARNRRRPPADDQDMLSLLYPERCAACDALTGGAPGLCGACAQSLYPLGPACPRCAEPATAAELCAVCLALPPPFASAHAAYRFGGELAAAIRRMKYGGRGDSGRPELVRPLAALLAPALAGSPAADLLVPVPLHDARTLTRGFSQAHRLAQLAGRFAPAPPLFPALVRGRATAEQAGLSRRERARNVEGAFSVPARRVRHVIGARVLLLDDVMTTGATATAATHALLDAGAAEVHVVVLARAE